MNKDDVIKQNQRHIYNIQQCSLLLSEHSDSLFGSRMDDEQRVELFSDSLKEYAEFIQARGIELRQRILSDAHEMMMRQQPAIILQGEVE